MTLATTRPTCCHRRARLIRQALTLGRKTAASGKSKNGKRSWITFAVSRPIDRANCQSYRWMSAPRRSELSGRVDLFLTLQKAKLRPSYFVESDECFACALTNDRSRETVPRAGTAAMGAKRTWRRKPGGRPRGQYRWAKAASPSAGLCPMTRRAALIGARKPWPTVPPPGGNYQPRG